MSMTPRNMANSNAAAVYNFAVPPQKQIKICGHTNKQYLRHARPERKKSIRPHRDADAL